MTAAGEAAGVAVQVEGSMAAARVSWLEQASENFLHHRTR